MEKHAASKSTNRRGKRSPGTAHPPAKTAPAAGDHRQLDPKTRHEMIAEAAYYLAEKRGFAPGKELDDWWEAESWIDQYMAGSGTH